MKLKILYFVLVFIFLKTNAQQQRIQLEGTVKYNSMYLPDINISNKMTLLGGASDKNGSFTILAMEGDSILFSSLVYTNRNIIISKTHLKSKKITIYLEPDYYQLKEIMLAKKIFLDWSKAAVTKGTILRTDKISNNKPPNARKLTDPNANAGGLNPIALFMMLTKKSRLKRKARKLDQKLELEKSKKLRAEFSTKIKNEYEATFFNEVLHISEENIYLFLDYCEGNGLLDFYKSEEIVIKNFLIKQSKEFKLIQK